MLKNGEHSKNSTPKTVIDMLEDDHIKMMQIAAVTFNFMGMSSRLPDVNSQVMVLDAALEQAKILIELFRLHIFREDNIVYPLAHKYINDKEFKTMKLSLKKNGY